MRGAATHVIQGLLTGLALSLALALALAGSARAECGVPYTTRAGETLFSIARDQYGDHEKWSLLYYGNQGKLAGSVLDIAPGTVLNIPCESTQVAPDATPLKQDSAEMTLLTGGDYAPFTDQDWPGGGLITEILNAALEMAPQPVPYAIVWEDDWSRHLFPLLDEKTYDMGFPWLRPDCEATPENERCANFHFSDPLFQLPIMLFTRTDNQFAFDSDADVVGRSLCRPKGYFTHDLDRADRRWLSDGKIRFVQADNPRDCFARLMAGQVDAVSLNLFVGANTVVDLGLKGKVTALPRPVSEEGLHVIISKRHWRGTTLLYRVNAGLRGLRESKRYDEIVARHLEIFQRRLKQ